MPKNFPHLPHFYHILTTFVQHFYHNLLHFYHILPHPHSAIPSARRWHRLVRHPGKFTTILPHFYHNVTTFLPHYLPHLSTRWPQNPHKIVVNFTTFLPHFYHNFTTFLPHFPLQRDPEFTTFLPHFYHCGKKGRACYMVRLDSVLAAPPRSP